VGARGNRGGAHAVLQAMTHIALGPEAPRRIRRGRLVVVPALLALATVACSPGVPATNAPSSPNPSGGPTAGPSAGPTVGPTIEGAIAHPTGPRDVVLRIEETGGLMPVESSVTYTPTFTLYGDGTVIWRDNFAMPPDSSDNLIRPAPLMITRLDEGTIQTLLAEAIGPGALGVAVGPYNELMGADIPSTIFTINAGGIPEPKRVEVVALSPEAHPKNRQVVAALAGLAEKLRAFDTLVSEQPYVPTDYRGVLMPTEQAFGPVVDWPWPDISPDDFGGDNESFRTRQMTADEVDALGIDNIASGVAGFVLQDGEDLYSFALRPLLPDDLG
jgi:hypothetical protein